VNKCVINGTVTYQQGPCPTSQVRKHPTVQEMNAEETKRRAAAAATAPKTLAPAASNQSSGLRCDGRQYCSQMTSCAEAKYFLANCPGVKMDGDKNGMPCEKQWCAR
jgi:Excalibur calcium-binding domain